MTAVNEKEEGIFPWLKYKFNYGVTYKGLITFTIVWEFIIVLFLGSFSEPITDLLGGPLIAVNLVDDPVEKAGRLVMLYHAIAVPFIAICTYFVLEFMDVREKLKPHVKWPLFIGSIIASASALIFEYLLPKAWILHGMFIVGLSLCFYAGVMLLIGVFPTKNFPKREQDGGPYLFGINIAQATLALLAICILISVILGAAIASYFGNGLIVFLAEYTLRDYDHIKYLTIFVDGIKAHLHVMLALIDAIILLAVYRYTVPDQKGRWYLLSMLLSIPGILILSIGAWLVTVKEAVPFDAHYLIYAGSAILVFVGVILAFTGWNRTSKEFLGESYESASWVARIKAVFKDPVKFSLYFQFIWVNFVMTFAGIFLALSLRVDSPITKVTGMVAFREGPEAIEVTVARGHWHVLAVLSAIILLLLFIDMIDIQGVVRKALAWLLFAGSILAFASAVIYMYFPHFDQDWATNPNLYTNVRDYISANMGIVPLIMYLGLTLFVIGITIFCFHQLIEILKGRKDVTKWPE